MKNFDIKHFLFSFEGRINRKPYWLFSLAVSILVVIISVIIQSILNFQGSGTTPQEFQNIMNIVAILFLWPALAVQVKRWHDIDKSGWFVLFNLIPFVGVFINLIFNGFIEGTHGENKYGQDPLNRQSNPTQPEEKEEITED